MSYSEAENLTRSRC